MDEKDIRKLLEDIKNDKISIEDGLKEIANYPFKDIGYAMIDNHREIRVGYPEVIYCKGKTVEQVTGIVQCMLERNCNILATRADEEMYNAVYNICKDAQYNKTARIITIKRKDISIPESFIAVVTAGTSDIPVAEEAAATAEFLGNRVERIFDVGVAGIHRLFSRIDIIRAAKVVVVVAGMEGALASVVAGLIDKPVIAVPTSVGYGANFGGLSALLTMLNSCASGVSVVNIDNGFGAGYLSSMINKL
ncbi:hypothetical protein SAMN05443428_11268 [Caloramator quimbayensis]|uniref:PurE domain-containing protein n=1 Tax=Caloramator quimbayensis TaxID=1147123 RepID=A0A1T4XSH3_9CLOT|nr:nickel pincer cofactor biosynthesis protein LarB [Caloramator quimbayensis]SKA92507.1 hypothetical protein SAMN05443428_11268 [Caloramator quimbayensis]